MMAIMLATCRTLPTYTTRTPIECACRISCTLYRRTISTRKDDDFGYFPIITFHRFSHRWWFSEIEMRPNRHAKVKQQASDGKMCAQQLHVSQRIIERHSPLRRTAWLGRDEVLIGTFWPNSAVCALCSARAVSSDDQMEHEGERAGKGKTNTNRKWNFNATVKIW